MKTVVMIGDSFGVPNYYGPPGAEPEIHVEFLLRKKKYNVINLSENASANERHYSQLSLFIATNPTIVIDYVVWFHNASMNLIPPLSIEFKITDVVKNRLLQSYKDMQELKKKHTAKWIVIGGSSPLPDFFYPFEIHDHVIPDWRAKILNENLPQVFGSGFTQNRDIIQSELNVESSEVKRKSIDDFNRIQRMLSRNRNLFPDGCHPGIKPHYDLANELDNLIQAWPAGASGEGRTHIGQLSVAHGI